MDDYTQKLLEQAYRTCKRKRKGTPTVANLRWEMWSHQADYRDGVIIEWAARMFKSTPPDRLALKWETVFDLLAREGVYASVWNWEWPLDDLRELAYTVAFGLAGLRWINRERAGRAPVPRCTDDEIEGWLAVKEPRQLSLF